MKSYSYLAVALCCLSFLAPTLSRSSDCPQITTWSEEDVRFTDWLRGMEGRIQACNNPPCSRQFLPASMRPLHDWTGLYGVYPKGAVWGIWLGISSFESDAVAQGRVRKMGRTSIVLPASEIPREGSRSVPASVAPVLSTMRRRANGSSRTAALSRPRKSTGGTSLPWGRTTLEIHRMSSRILAMSNWNFTAKFQIMPIPL